MMDARARHATSSSPPEPAMSVDSLPPELDALRTRLSAFLQEELLPLERERAAAFAFTDARQGPRTTAVQRGDGFRVSGVKSFVTGGPHADLLLTVANVTENEDGPTGTAIFIVPRQSPGVTLRRELRTLDG